MVRQCSASCCICDSSQHEYWCRPGCNSDLPKRTRESWHKKSHATAKEAQHDAAASLFWGDQRGGGQAPVRPHLDTGNSGGVGPRARGSRNQRARPGATGLGDRYRRPEDGLRRPHVISHRPGGRIAVQRLVVRCVARLCIRSTIPSTDETPTALHHPGRWRRPTWYATGETERILKGLVDPAAGVDLPGRALPVFRYAREWRWSADGQPSVRGDGQNQPNGDES
jgi:hypothetical protein